MVGRIVRIAFGQQRTTLVVLAFRARPRLASVDSGHGEVDGQEQADGDYQPDDRRDESRRIPGPRVGDVGRFAHAAPFPRATRSRDRWTPNESRMSSSVTM